MTLSVSAPPTRRSPRWIPFTVIVAATAVLLTFPGVLGLFAPDRAEGTVGVFQRESLIAVDGNLGVAGVIAPEGWLKVPGEDRSELGFVRPDGSAIIALSLHTGGADADLLLREDLPFGAALTPIRPLAPIGRSEVSMLEFDLSAGNTISQRIAACQTVIKNGCLVFDVEAEAGAFTEDGLLPDVVRMIESAEVIG